MRPDIFTYATGNTLIIIGSERHDHEMIICTKVPIGFHPQLGLGKIGKPIRKGVEPFFRDDFLFVLTGLDAHCIESCVFYDKHDPENLYGNICAEHAVDKNCVSHLVDESDHGYEPLDFDCPIPDSVYMLRYVDMNTLITAFELYALFKNTNEHAVSEFKGCNIYDASCTFPSIACPPMELLDAGDDGYGLVWFSDIGMPNFLIERNEEFKIEFPGLYTAIALGQNNPDVCPVKFVGMRCYRERNAYNSNQDYFHDAITVIDKNEIFGTDYGKIKTWRSTIISERKSA